MLAEVAEKITTELSDQLLKDLVSNYTNLLSETEGVQ